MGSLPNPPNGPADYLDVNGDGSVTPLDALIVINFLNAQALSSGQSTAAALVADVVSASSAAAGAVPPAAVAFGLQATIPAPDPIVVRDFLAAGSLTQENSTVVHTTADRPTANLGIGPSRIVPTAAVLRPGILDSASLTRGGPYEKLPDDQR